MSSLHMFSEKNMFYNETSLKGSSTFSSVSLAFSIASVIPALLKRFIAISMSSLTLTIHLAWKFSGLEIMLLLKSSCPEQKTFEKMKNFVDSLYDYDYSGVNDGDSSDEEEATIVIETDQSVSHKQSVTRRLVSHNWSVTLTVVVKKTSMLTLILTNQLTSSLIVYFLK